MQIKKLRANCISKSDFIAIKKEKSDYFNTIVKSYVKNKKWDIKSKNVIKTELLLCNLKLFLI